MKLTPQERDKLLIHEVGALAQKRLARGVRLNHPEAVALLCTQLLELIREGRSVAELMQLGRTMLGRRNVMDGVAALIPDVQVEGTFPDGTKLVTVHEPIVRDHGDLALALYGSFLPVPPPERFAPQQDEDATPPGAYRVQPGSIEINAGRRGRMLRVTNTGDRPVQVGSHYPFTEVNRALVFDRLATVGMRLDIPAGTAVRFEPGEQKQVALVEIAGRRVVRGGNALVNGPADDAEHVAARIEQARFGHRAER